MRLFCDGYNKMTEYIHKCMLSLDVFCYIYPLTTECFLPNDIKMTLLFYSKNHNSCIHVANSTSSSSHFVVPRSQYNDVEWVELSLAHYCYPHCVKMWLFLPCAVLWILLVISECHKKWYTFRGMSTVKSQNQTRPFHSLNYSFLL